VGVSGELEIDGLQAVFVHARLVLEQDHEAVGRWGGVVAR
jgi:hypothetical protein